MRPEELAATPAEEKVIDGSISFPRIRATASAMGLRHVLPVQINNIFIYGSIDIFLYKILGKNAIARSSVIEVTDASRILKIRDAVIEMRVIFRGYA